MKKKAEEDEAKTSAKSQKDRYHNIEEVNIVVEKSRLLKLINQCNKEHKELEQCDAVDSWDIVDLESWGLYSIVAVTCLQCGYKSKRTKLYEELDTGKRGRKSAVGNVRLQLMLQDTPIVCCYRIECWQLKQHAKWSVQGCSGN